LPDQPGTPTGSNEEVPIQGVEATGPPLHAASRIDGVSFPVADLNPNDLQNNCVYVTMAACLNMPLINSCKASMFK
jgi:hypothetical protein